MIAFARFGDPNLVVRAAAHAPFTVGQFEHRGGRQFRFDIASANEARTEMRAPSSFPGRMDFWRLGRLQ